MFNSVGGLGIWIVFPFLSLSLQMNARNIVHKHENYMYLVVFVCVNQLGTNYPLELHINRLLAQDSALPI